MGVDSSQYAAISREMNETKSFLEVTLSGNDYLDKPPLLFWVNAWLFEIFGYSNWAFKLGSFLFSLLAVFSTFRLGRLLYSAETGRLAAIILYSCQAFFLFNNDVRTDTMLTGAVIFTIWQWVEWLHSYKWKWLIGASLGIALAMLAKGPVGLMVPALAVASYLVGAGRWGDFLRWQYLIMLVLVALLISPMLYGLYTQFDAHPEKTVAMVTSDGVKYEQNVSGLRFYLWTQSFGRITGENAWQNNAGALFFVHNLLWSFLPWALLFILAFFTRFVRIIKSATSGAQLPELLTLGGFLLPFIILSMSSYKLPHYIFPLYPLAAILTASWWEQSVWREKLSLAQFNTALVFQILVGLASLGVCFMIYFQFFPGAEWWKLVLTTAAFLSAITWLLKSKKKPANLIVFSVLLSIGVNFTLNAHFYPRLLKYQSGSEIAFSIHQNNIDSDNVLMYHFYSFSFLYYLEDTFVEIASDELVEDRLLEGQETYLVTTDPYLEDIRKDFKISIIDQIGTHSVTLLDMKFLSADTRDHELKNVYLLKIEDIRD